MCSSRASTPCPLGGAASSPHSAACPPLRLLLRPGLCSRGLGTCLSLVRRANESTWPTSSSLAVSHFQMKIIKTHTRRGWGAREAWAAQSQHKDSRGTGCSNLATCRRCVESRTHADKYQAGDGQAAREGHRVLAWLLVLGGGGGRGADGTLLPTQLVTLSHASPTASHCHPASSLLCNPL